MALFVFMDSLSEYTKAVIEHHKGNKELAGKYLSKAVGSEKTLPVIVSSIDNMLVPGSPAMRLLLTMVSANKED